MKKISSKQINSLYSNLNQQAESRGYHLNADKKFTKELVRSLLTNESRYGYRACPCRLAVGVKKIDLDIICPCDYRDTDLLEHNACYCALYVSSDAASNKVEVNPIPERRPQDLKERNMKKKYPVWRCKVCGYLCSREEAPEVCPICFAKAERFEKVSL